MEFGGGVGGEHQAAAEAGTCGPGRLQFGHPVGGDAADGVDGERDGLGDFP